MPALPLLAPKPSPAQTVAWLSEHRYQAYLTMAAGDHDMALEIYVWNTELSSSILRDLAHVEVAVRNALDAQLSAIFPEWGVEATPGWLLLTNGTSRARATQQRLNTDSLALLAKAQKAVQPGLTHGRVVARLSFGFWKFLLSSRARDSTLWTPYLHKAFPKGTPRSEVATYMESAVSLRNRLAHLEPVASASTSVAERLTHINKLFSLVAPEVHKWIWDRSDTMAIIAREPMPGLISMTPKPQP